MFDVKRLDLAGVYFSFWIVVDSNKQDIASVRCNCVGIVFFFDLRYSCFCSLVVLELYDNCRLVNIFSWYKNYVGISVA